MFWRALSLRSKLFVLALASLVVMGCLAFVQGYQSYQSRKAEIKTGFVAHAVGAARGIASSFFERYTDVHAFSRNAVFQGGKREQIVQAINGLVEGYQVYDVIMFVDQNGQFVAANTVSADGRVLDNKIMEGRSFAETPWFQRAARGEFTEDKQRGFSGTVVEDLQIDPISSALFGSTQYGVGFTRPVFDANGQLIGVLTARTSLRFIENELRAGLETLRVTGAGSAHIMLINKDGLVAAEVSSDLLAEKGEVKRNSDRILRWNVATQQGQVAAQEALVGRMGSLIEVDRIGRSERLWGFYPMRDIRFPSQMNWSVIVNAKTDEVLGEVVAQRQIFSFVVAGLVVLLSLVGYGASRSVSRDFLEISVRMKDETHRLIEVSDEFSEVVGKSLREDKHDVIELNQIFQQSREIFTGGDDRWSALNTSLESMRRFMVEIEEGFRSAKELSEEVSSVNAHLGLLSQSGASLSAVQAKLTALNELVFRAQLVGFNLQIEANKSTTLRSLTSVSDEVLALSEQSELIARDFSEHLARAQRQLLESERLTRERVAHLESTLHALVHLLGRLDAGLPALHDVLSSSAHSAQRNEIALKDLIQSFENVTSAVAPSVRSPYELSRYANEIRDQSYRLDDLAQELATVVKGGRLRGRGKRHQQQQGALFQGFSYSHSSSDRARADAVDRLAQKMRPRLVVKSDDHEPEVSDVATSDEAPRKAG